MKIGIAGPTERAVAWEQHLRPHRSVSEVVIAPSLDEVGAVDACFLLDESDERLKNVLKAIRLGLHTFLIARLPTDLSRVEKVYHAAEEANTVLQFSHWPSLAPASQWMMGKVTKPTWLQVNREIGYYQFQEMDTTLEYLWMDERAFCLKWIGEAVHDIDGQQINLGSAQPIGIHIFLRFDSGATAGLYVNGVASESSHKRLAADNFFMLECDVQSQAVRVGRRAEHGSLFFERHEFEATRSAELAATQFLKAIQLRRSSAFNGYDALRLCQTVDKIRQRLYRFS